MGFLDNSRDIIVDAVLTDLGRKLLAEGGGNFQITQFALGDDEINYGLYDINHPSGSAYYDLDILQTPVFEAFTNNSAALNSKLITYSNNTFLYLPVMKLNQKGFQNGSTVLEGDNILPGGQEMSVGIPALFSTPVMIISVDDRTSRTLDGPGHIRGENPKNVQYIRIDQGLDNNKNPEESLQKTQLLEDKYQVEIDSRLGQLSYDKTLLKPDFTDDDDIGTYLFSLGSDKVQNVYTLKPYTESDKATNSSFVSINGKRGTALWFAVCSSEDLKTDSNYWFDTLGNSTTVSVSGNPVEFKYIHSTITVTGLTTGYSIDIPVAFVKAIL